MWTFYPRFQDVESIEIMAIWFTTFLDNSLPTNVLSIDPPKSGLLKDNSKSYSWFSLNVTKKIVVTNARITPYPI